MADIGHNQVAGGLLRALVERIERLESNKEAITTDIREVYAEAKAQGFDSKTLRKVVALRKKPAEERQEEEALLDLYLSALGMLPLWQHAEKGAGSPENEEASLNAKIGDAITKAAHELGEPVPLTDAERAKGMTAAFRKPDGTRMSISVGKGGES